MTPYPRASRAMGGFTLLEVMVALLIFALFAAAVQRAGSQYYSQFERIEGKTLATWIAENRIARLQLGNSLPAVSDNSEEMDFADRHWRVETRVSTTQAPSIRRVDVTVFLFDNGDGNPKQQLTFTGFVGRQ